MRYLYKDGILSQSNTKGHDLILSYSNITFTTLRTLKQRLIPELDSHVNRLVSKQLTFDQVKQQIKNAIKLFFTVFKEDIRVYCFSVSANLEFFAEVLPIRISKSNFIIKTAVRENPQIKSVNWCIERQELEKFLSANVNEVIMINDDLITEGLSSNCFMIKGNNLYTAGDSIVLGGNVRKMTIKAAEKNNVNVIMNQFSVQDLKTADCIFVTSTSRGLLMGKKVSYNETTIEFQDCLVFQQLSEQYDNLLEINSEKIFD